MKPKGLNLTVVFKAQSLSYGEGLGNYNQIKKLTLSNGEQRAYLSKQALGFNIRTQMVTENELTPISSTKKIKAEDGEGKDVGVLQYHPLSNIFEHPEIDLFGYMKTGESKDKIDKNLPEEEKLKLARTKTRSAVVRLTDAVALDAYHGCVDFLTNKGMFDRFSKNSNISGGNIAQIEKHSGFYVYTMTVDLEKIGVDVHCEKEVPMQERARRIERLLDTVCLLYRDIKGRREDLSPLFVIGGISDYKNPMFANAIKMDRNQIKISPILQKLKIGSAQKTLVGIVADVFDNEEELIEKLSEKATVYDVADMIEELKKGVREYYGK